MFLVKTSSILFTTNFFLGAFHPSKDNEYDGCQLRMVGLSSQFKTCVFHGTNECKNMIPQGKYAQVPQGNMVS
jgi:hypothetical protein